MALTFSPNTNISVRLFYSPIPTPARLSFALLVIVSYLLGSAPFDYGSCPIEHWWPEGLI